MRQLVKFPLCRTQVAPYVAWVFRAKSHLSRVSHVKKIKEVRVYIQNLDEIEAALDPFSILDLVLSGTKKQRCGKQLRSRCPIHGGDRDGNFALNLDTHEWCCFSRGCKGRGLISLYSQSARISFKEAIEELASQFCIPIRYNKASAWHGPVTKSSNRVATSSPIPFMPKPLYVPPESWQKRAMEFVEKSHCAALESSIAIRLLGERGLTIETIKKFSVGWNAIERRDARNLWGLSFEETGKDIWLPKGIVLPTFFDGQVMRLRIRRVDLKPGDDNKYIAVSGNRSTPSFYGKTSDLPIFLLESEIDSLLIQQQAGDLCSCMAIPAGQRPDAYADEILRAAPFLIFSLDFDKAGISQYSFWKTAYPEMKIWLADGGKSPGDDFKQGVDLREWVKAGLAQ